MSSRKPGFALRGAVRGVGDQVRRVCKAPLDFVRLFTTDTLLLYHAPHKSQRQDPVFQKAGLEQFEHEESGTLTPLPATRPRRLTLDCESETYSKDAYACSQSQCSFITLLPKEIRLQIYEIALGDPERLLHLAKAYQKLTHIRCFGEKEGKLPWRHLCWGQTWRDGAFRAHHPNRLPEDRDLTGILRTCRTM